MRIQLVSSLALLLGIVKGAVAANAQSHTTQHNAAGRPHSGGVSIDLHSPVLGFEPEAFKAIIEELMLNPHVIEPTHDTSFENPHAPGAGGKLANLFVRLQRYLFATGILPLSMWGRMPPGVDGGYDSPNPHLSRLSINVFWDEVKDEIPPNSRCLEMVPAHYTAKHPNCAEVWSMDYEADTTKQRADVAGKMVYGDLINFTVSRMFGTFDAIVLTNAFQYPADPYKALANLHSLLKPGGLLVTTQPFIEKDISQMVYYPEGFRFSDRIMNRMLEESDFEIEKAYRAGNTLLSTGFLLGYGSADYSPRELEAALLPTLTGDDGYYGTCYLVRKPHAAASAVAKTTAATTTTTAPGATTSKVTTARAGMGAVNASAESAVRPSMRRV